MFLPGLLNQKAVLTAMIRLGTRNPLMFAFGCRGIARSSQYVRSVTTTSLAAPCKKQPAIVFDIDGVLIQGGCVLGEARRALSRINGNNPQKTIVPHLFLTNGGGITEQAKALDLSKKLGVPISPEQVVLAHSPMQELVHKYGGKCVLAVGGTGTNCKEVLHSYGFQNVVTPYQYVRWNHAIAPFCEVPGEMIDAHGTPPDLSKIHIAAILVMHDSRDWGTDLQVMLDVLRSPNGCLGKAAAARACGTHGALNSISQELREALGRQNVPIYLSNPDLLWANEFPLPRFAQGATRVALEVLWKGVTGTDLNFTTYGKPETPTYKFAFNALYKQIGKFTELPELDPTSSIANSNNPHFEVYAIGDNPAGDIEGANRHGWHSLLVETGVYQGGIPSAQPSKIVAHVEEAVDLIWQRHFEPRYDAEF